jgi:hypothetical protein
LHFNAEGWIGNPLDPIACLFDTLAEASLTADSRPLDYFYGIYSGEVSPGHSSASGPTLAPPSSSSQSSAGNVISAGHSLLEPPEQLSANSEIVGNHWLSAINSKPASDRPFYQHVHVPCSRDRCETYLSLAVEAALIALGQQRNLPVGNHAQFEMFRQEEKLLNKMVDIEVDALLVHVLRKQALTLLDAGPYSSLGQGIHVNSVPSHAFARFLFSALLPFDRELAFSVALRAMRLPLFDPDPTAPEEDIADHKQDPESLRNVRESPNKSSDGPQLPQVFIVSALEEQQSALASSMLQAARRDVLQLKHVQKSLQRHVHSANQLFHLAQEAFHTAVPNASNPAASTRGGSNSASTESSVATHSASQHQPIQPPTLLPPLDSFTIPSTSSCAVPTAHSSGSSFGSASLPVTQFTFASKYANNQRPITDLYLLDTSFEIALQVARKTLGQVDLKRRDFLRWLINCACELGFSALLHLLHNWPTLFSPVEAVASVTSAIQTPLLSVKMTLDLPQHDELQEAIKTLALQCATEDPAGCSLNALNLCEADASAFDAVYCVVYKAGQNSEMNTSQLFFVAHYMEQRGHAHRAFKLCMLAIRSVHVGYNGENHPCIADINWTCALAQSLGKGPLSTLVPLLVKNVQCASILSDLLRRFVNGFSLPATTPLTSGLPSLALSSNSSALPPPPLGSISSTTATTASGASLPPTYSSVGTSSAYNSLLASTAINTPPILSSSSPSYLTTGSLLTTKSIGLDQSPLSPLLDAAIHAYVATAHSRLTNISPRHYADFVEFLSKAKETFTLSPDGASRFDQLLDNMRRAYKGKKKLLCLVHERFGV